MNPYNTSIEFFSRHAIMIKGLNAKYPFRMCTGEHGHYRGCPNSQGKLMVTNGVIAFSEREDGSYFIGHLDNFIADQQDDVEKPASTRRQQRITLLEELFS